MSSVTSGADDAPIISSGPPPTITTIPGPGAVEELGRTFQGYGDEKYLLPNDEEEKGRLDLQHEIWFRLMKGDLYRAPIGKPKTILDAGTGTGIWAILFARQFPEVNVVASDLSPIQPPNAPSNFTFVQGDMEEPWGYEKPFDYIHLRMMCTCFSAPKKIIQNVFDNLAPGGWCEYQEFAPESIHGSDPASDQLLRSSAFYRATDLVILGMKNLGRDISVAHKYKQWMEEVGFTDIVEEKILCPLNDWPLDPEQRALGKIYREHAEVGVGSMVKLLLAAGAKMDEIPQIQEGVNKALSDTNLRAYATYYIVYGRKPVSPMVHGS